MRKNSLDFMTRYAAQAINCPDILQIIRTKGNHAVNGTTETHDVVIFGGLSGIVTRRMPFRIRRFNYRYPGFLLNSSRV